MNGVIACNWRDGETGCSLRIAGTVGLTFVEAAGRWLNLPEDLAGDIDAELWRGGKLVDTVRVTRATVERHYNESFEDMIRDARRSHADDLERRGDTAGAYRLRAVLRREQRRLRA